ncbi:MAG TPA: cell division protein ZapA [Bacteroidales bacterium]|nr:cell division protein ZapA [Bacteroidales bacterium]HRZ49388.1 cell division protein ZapA [Bacteroidales bacterium]
MDEIPIAIHIAGRQYRLRADEQEKEQIEEAARRINRSIRLHAEHFAYKDNQDLLAMVSLQQTLAIVQCEHTLDGVERRTELLFSEACEPEKEDDNA